MSSSCTDIIVHPTHEHGLLSCIVPTLTPQRDVVLTFLPGGPRILQVRQDVNNADNVGQLLWRSGVSLASWLGKQATSTTIFKGQRVLELGCGCAPLVSIVAAEWGAECALATDGDEAVIALAEENLLKNTRAQNVACAPLKWGDCPQMEKLRRQHGGDDGFDIIVAADVIYFEGGHKPLVETMITMGSRQTVYYLAFQKRLHSFEGEFFSKLLPECGFKCEAVWAGDGGGGWDNLGIVKMVYRPIPTGIPSKKSQAPPAARAKHRISKKGRGRLETRKDTIRTAIQTLAKGNETAVHDYISQIGAGEANDGVILSFSKSVLSFSPTLSSSDRRFVHSIAARHSIFHWSIGAGPARRVQCSCVQHEPGPAADEETLKQQHYQNQQQETSTISNVYGMKPTGGPGGSITYHNLPKPQRHFQKFHPSETLQNEQKITCTQHPHKSSVHGLIAAASTEAARLRRQIRDQSLPASTPLSANVPPAVWVDTIGALQSLATSLVTCAYVAVDLEMHNVRSYYGFTCLIQLSLPDSTDYLVDTIALWDHIGKILGPFFADPKICKVFHSCEGGDIAALHRDFRIFCCNLFDTQHAARILGLPLGLGKLLAEVVPGANIALKTHSTTMSDWRVRPLTENQAEYARLDTRYLLRLRVQLIARLAGIDSESLFDKGDEDGMMDMLGAASQFGLGEQGLSQPLTQLEKEIMNGDHNISSSDEEGRGGVEGGLEVAFEEASHQRSLSSNGLSTEAPVFIPASIMMARNSSISPKSSTASSRTPKPPAADVEADALCYCLVVSQKSSLKLFKARKPVLERARKKLRKNNKHRKMSAPQKDLFLELFLWREGVAQAKDESAEFVCSEGIMSAICRGSWTGKSKRGNRAPETLPELRKAWSPLPELLRGSAGDEDVLRGLFAVTQEWNRKERGGKR